MTNLELGMTAHRTFSEVLVSQPHHTILRTLHTQAGPLLNMAWRSAPAHDFHNPGTEDLVIMAVPEYRLTSALFDLGWGWRDHFCADPHPLHLLPPKTEYRWTVNGPSVTLMLALPTSVILPIFEELDIAHPMQGLWSLMDRGFAHPLAYELLVSLWNTTATPETCPPILVESYQVNILHALATKWSCRRDEGRAAGTLRASVLKKVLDHVEGRLTSPVSLSELAQAVGMSRFHFLRSFKQTTGYSPHQYVLRTRIERARSLLVTTSTSISFIANAVGFADQSGFARAFKKVVGCAPQVYRRANSR